MQSFKSSQLAAWLSLVLSQSDNMVHYGPSDYIFIFASKRLFSKSGHGLKLNICIVSSCNLSRNSSLIIFSPLTKHISPALMHPCILETVLLCNGLSGFAGVNID